MIGKQIIVSLEPKSYCQYHLSLSVRK